MRGIVFLFGLLFSTSVLAQFHDPVKWSMTQQKVGGNEFEISFTADIEEGWNVYSQYLESEDGPIPTSFNYDEGDHFELVGKNVEEGFKKEGHDEVFDMNLVKFYKKVTFTQRLKILDASKPVKGYLEFMTCDDERCLPPAEKEFEFLFDLGASNEGGAPEGELASADLASEQQEAETVIPSEEATEVEPVNQIPSGLIEPVKWNLRIDPAEDGQYTLIFEAKMEEGWSIYSQHTEDNGPIPTEFDFDEGDHYEVVGEVEEKGKKKEGPDPIFDGVNVIKYVNSPVLFSQKVKVTDPAESITGYFMFMACDDKMCLPPEEVPFSFNIAKNQVVIRNEIPLAEGDTPAAKSGFKDVYNTSVPNVEAPLGQCGESQERSANLWNIFILGLAAGFIALLTPCVFPMIPLTVSFFTKGSENRRKGITNAILYGFFIFLIYILLSVPFHVMDSVNSDILSQISTNVALNLFFFAIFLFFAFSFFGYYEIALPSSWSNRSSSAESAGGLIGIFFMALTLALVSFSCTGPILGTLLVGAVTADGGAMQLTAGMGGFGLALALPFGLFAAFPGWMNSLPKSGGWLNTVKVVLGFIELALAFKFLSNADLVQRWGLLKIEPFLIIWILIAIAMALYLFGFIKFPHDSPGRQTSPVKTGLGLASLGIAVYLAFGFQYNKGIGSYQPLTVLSGLAPPVCYSWIYPCDCPQGLTCFKDYAEGMAYARKVNKPVMIDFTGYACVNCRKMEEHVWPRSQVYNYLKDDYVLISLYVDDKKLLPEKEQVMVERVTGETRRLRNYGHKWANFQEYFGANSQPYYVLLTPEGKPLNAPVGYTPDPEEYAQFLECGLTTFKRISER